MVFGQQNAPAIVCCPFRATGPSAGDEKLAEDLVDVRVMKSIKSALSFHFSAIQLIPSVETDSVG